MSSTHSYRAPLIRRILPWIYVGLFLVTAPLLIFYTSGYRYNFKKGVIERNGTLIVDSIPSGSDVFIDHQPSGEKTPVTFQQMAPGWHSVRVTKAGYGSWQQEVFVRAERVSFIDRVRLWKQGDPVLVSRGNYVRLKSDPAGERMLAFKHVEQDLQIGWWSPIQSANFVPFPVVHGEDYPLRWRSDGEAVVLGGTAAIPDTWFVKAARARTSIESVPDGRYHWSGAKLIGVAANSSLTVDVENGQIERRVLPALTHETSGSIELRTSTSTGRLLLADSSFLGRLFSLPSGNWSIHEWRRPYLFVSDGRHWLGTRLRLGSLPDTVRVEGDYPRWSPDLKNPRAAFVNEHEISIWSPEGPATVIWRQSTPILSAVWNEDGNVLYVADAQRVFALALDSGQDVKPVHLGTFDRVWDVTVQGTSIFAVGERGQDRGIFKLPGM